MKTYVFPGQGSQAKGMGDGLFDKYPDLVEKADAILGYSIKELCLSDPRRELGKTQFTQPALYVVNALHYYDKIEKEGAEPDFVAGHSLGEFNALLAAECFDFEAGLKIVKKRGELMSQAKDGAMAAILNASAEVIENLLKENNLEKIDIANINTFSQIVISGSIEEIGKAEPLFTKGEMLYYPLNTSGAFHSRFMAPSRDKFLAYLKRFKLSNPKIPVIANVTARPYEADNIIDPLSNQIATGVRWAESMFFLLEHAAEKGEVMAIEEVGHGDVLTKIVAKIIEETKDKITEIKGEPTEQAQSSSIEEVSAPTEQPEKNADEKVAEWNRKYTIGTKVKSIYPVYDQLETRTQAVVLFGHRAAVYMKDYNGYFDLDELEVVAS